MCRGISTQDISLEEWLVVDWHPNHSNGSGGKDCSHPRKHSDTVKVATHRVATANWATTLDALLSIGNTSCVMVCPFMLFRERVMRCGVRQSLLRLSRGAGCRTGWLSFHNPPDYLSLRACREHWAAQLDCFVLSGTN